MTREKMITALDDWDIGGLTSLVAGTSPHEMAMSFARGLRKPGPVPQGWTAGELLELADALDRGDLDRDIAARMGYC
jgi:hypothetical protein